LNLQHGKGENSRLEELKVPEKERERQTDLQGDQSDYKKRQRRNKWLTSG